MAHSLMADAQASAAPGEGLVVWLTGLSGAGKTTVGTLLRDRMTAQGIPCLLLDGDRLRELFGSPARHDRHHRLELALAYGRLCRELAAMGVNVVCATMSLFHAVHDWNRANIPRYLEIYLDVPLDELKLRDPKAIYARAAAGELDHVVGIHFAPDEPRQPHLTVRNCGKVSPVDSVGMIWPLVAAELHKAAPWVP